jgi:ribosome biogenesis GTPase
MTGTVYKSTGSHYNVKTTAGDFYECRIKGKFRLQGIKSTNPVAVGDVVDFELQEIADEAIGIIHHIQERRNYLVRKSVNLSKQLHILAANIDQAFLMITLQTPPTLSVFVDRFLASCEVFDIKVILLFNKVDLHDEDLQMETAFLKHTYEQIGYECFEISALKGTHKDVLIEKMKGKTTLLAGHSGVGKSTLINTIDPKLNLKTAEVSETHLQGQHTTTFAEMYDLDFGGRIIDSPGIRGFGLFDFQKEEIGDCFPEFFALKSDCKFHNCLHINEPGCAVKAALDEDRVSWSRYQSYVQMLDDDEGNYREDIYKQE